MEPYEIIANPLTLWLAPSGEAFPAIDAAPAGNWAKIGTSGTRNYSEEGLVVSASVSFQKARPAGASGPVKAFIDEEDLMFRLTVRQGAERQHRHHHGGRIGDCWLQEDRLEPGPQRDGIRAAGAWPFTLR
jgi:hypothetical protein